MSSLFSPFRCIGKVSSDKPFALNQLGDKGFLTTSIGNSFQVYAIDKLRLVLASPPTSHVIQAVAVVGERTFTAMEKVILGWNRAEVVSTWTCKDKVEHLFLFGEVLLAISGFVLYVWNINDGTCTEFCLSKDLGEVRFMIHPPTYLNKILIGFAHGMELINIRSLSKIHRFSISCELSCACICGLDLIALGTSEGITLWNLMQDVLVKKIPNSEISNICVFNKDQIEYMAASSGSKISLYQWRESKLIQVIEVSQKIVSMQSILGAVFVSADNSLEMYMLDNESLRLLKSRSGHAATPSIIRIMGDVMFTAAQDGVRSQSLRRDETARVLSNQFQNSKGSTIIDMAVSSVKERDFSNMLTVGTRGKSLRDEHVCTLWSTKNSIATFQYSHDFSITCCAISGCGNFGLIGDIKGNIIRFNMQSRIKRASYETSEPVVSIRCDVLNRYIVVLTRSSLYQFDFNTGKVLEKWDFPNANSLAFHPLNSMVAVACASRGAENFAEIFVVDMDRRRIVRQFVTNSDYIFSLCFTPNGRWLYAACIDATICVFDLVSGHTIDWLGFPCAVTCLETSRQGEFLLTSHANKRGVYIWANMDWFGKVFLKKVSKPFELSIEMENLELDEVDVEVVGQKRPNDSSEEELSDNEDIGEVESAVDDELIVMSSLPRSKWVNLSQVDEIKARNKPKVSAKPKVDMPFFLPSLHSTFELPSVKRSTTANLKHDQIVADESTPTTKWIQSKLVVLLAAEDSSQVYAYLSEMSASAVDAAIRSLGSDILYEEKEFSLFISFLITELRKPSIQNVDLLQAYMNLFLKIHSSSLLTYESIRKPLEILKELQRKMWKRFEEAFQSNASLVQYLSQVL